VTKKQKKAVRKGLRQYGQTADRKSGPARAWGRVITRALEDYDREDPVCAELLRKRYLEGMSEWDVVGALHIGRTTYYRKELEALSTVAVYAAAAGLI